MILDDWMILENLLSEMFDLMMHPGLCSQSLLIVSDLLVFIGNGLMDIGQLQCIFSQEIWRWQKLSFDVFQVELLSLKAREPLVEVGCLELNH